MTPHSLFSSFNTFLTFIVNYNLIFYYFLPPPSTTTCILTSPYSLPTCQPSLSPLLHPYYFKLLFFSLLIFFFLLFLFSLLFLYLFFPSFMSGSKFSSPVDQTFITKLSLGHQSCSNFNFFYHSILFFFCFLFSSHLSNVNSNKSLLF